MKPCQPLFSRALFNGVWRREFKRRTQGVSPSLGQHRAADARVQRRFHFTHRGRGLKQIKEDVSRQSSADYGTAVAEVVNGKDQLPHPKLVEHEADAVRRVVER